MIDKYVENLISTYEEAKISMRENGDIKYWQKNLRELHMHHLKNNDTYRKITRNFFRDIDEDIDSRGKMDRFPFVPVSLFKEYDMLSIDKELIFKTLLSSGTSGSQSKVFLSKSNARAQVASLEKIFSDYTNLRRPLMYAFDSKNTLRSTNTMNAKKAALLGFGQLCKRINFLLDDEGDLVNNKELVGNNNQEYLFFGFTSVIWNTLDQFRISEEEKLKLNKKAVILHGGGWKKLQSLNITDEMFKDKIKRSLGISKVINYYGMVEQTGSVFMECTEGRMHTNPLTNIICRDPNTLNVSDDSQVGLAQVISLLPTSYPGHSILTDDLISIYPDECKCGRRTTSFKIHGRKPRVEARGCSDV